MSDVEYLKYENLKLRNYISLIAAEEELIQRVSRFENLANSSECILIPILSRIDKIKSEKQILENNFELK